MKRLRYNNAFQRTPSGATFLAVTASSVARLGPLNLAVTRLRRVGFGSTVPLDTQPLVAASGLGAPIVFAASPSPLTSSLCLRTPSRVTHRRRPTPGGHA